jgi:hypothetical protein
MLAWLSRNEVWRLSCDEAGFAMKIGEAFRDRAAQLD